MKRKIYFLVLATLFFLTGCGASRRKVSQITIHPAPQRPQKQVITVNVKTNNDCVPCTNGPEEKKGTVKKKSVSVTVKPVVSSQLQRQNMQPASPSLWPVIPSKTVHIYNFWGNPTRRAFINNGTLPLWVQVNNEDPFKLIPNRGTVNMYFEPGVHIIRYWAEIQTLELPQKIRSGRIREIKMKVNINDKSGKTYRLSP